MGSTTTVATTTDPSHVPVPVSSTSINNITRKCSAPSPSSPSQICKRSMEEVWQEINLSTLLDHPNPGPDITAVAFHFDGPPVSLQDFLARPFHKDCNNPSSRNFSAVDCSSSAFLRRPPPTAISLHSGLGYDNNCNHNPVSGDTGADSDVSQLHSDHIPATPSFIASVRSLHNPFMCKKTAVPRPENCEDHFGQRQKRLMKNRESASRSRARKQAYMTELEKEVDHLQAENAKLRRQYQELKLSGPALLPQKKSLRRTLTAPF